MGRGLEFDFGQKTNDIVHQRELEQYVGIDKTLITRYFVRTLYIDSYVVRLLAS